MVHGQTVISQTPPAPISKLHPASCDTIRRSRIFSAAASRLGIRARRSRGEPDRVVVDVQVQLPPVGVGGKPHVAALGAGGYQGNLGLHAHESCRLGCVIDGEIPFHRVPPVRASRQTLRRNPLPLGRSGRLKSLRPTAPAAARRRCLPVDERRSASTRTRSGLKRSRRKSRSILRRCPIDRIRKRRDATCCASQQRGRRRKRAIQPPTPRRQVKVVSAKAQTPVPVLVVDDSDVAQTAICPQLAFPHRIGDGREPLRRKANLEAAGSCVCGPPPQAAK